jgi:hypothetical protein
MEGARHLVPHFNLAQNQAARGVACSKSRKKQEKFLCSCGRGRGDNGCPPPRWCVVGPASACERAGRVVGSVSASCWCSVADSQGAAEHGRPRPAVVEFPATGRQGPSIGPWFTAASSTVDTIKAQNVPRLVFGKLWLPEIVWWGKLKPHL